MALWRLMRWARGAGFLILLALFAFAVSIGGAARAADSLYDVAKLSVDVTAKDAVAARETGMADAQMRAVKIVLQRLLPLSAQDQLPELSPEDVEGMVNGVSIRKEQNSTTRYIAILDVSVSERAIKQLLEDQAIPYSEERAPAISILPLCSPEGARGEEDWRQAWEDIDLSHSVTPATILRPRPDLDIANRQSRARRRRPSLGLDARGLRLRAAGHRRGRGRGRQVRDPAGRRRRRRRYQFRAQRQA